MNKLTLAAEDSSNLAAFLIPLYNITTDFYCVYFDKVNHQNFDVYLNFDDSYGVISKVDIFNVPKIGMHRYPKNLQSKILEDLEIRTPKSIVISNTKGRRNDVIYSILKDYEPDTKFVCKPNNGARGLGGCLLNIDEIYDIVEDSLNTSITDLEFVEKYNIGGSFHYKDSELNFIRESYQKHDFVIQEKLEIKKEFRVIYGFDCEPIIYERKIDHSKSWQSNTSIVGKGSLYNSSPTNWEDHSYIQKAFENEIKSIGEKMFTRFNTPFFCADVYITNGNSIGVLEFQMNMGYQDIPKSKLVDLVQNGTTNLLKKLNIISNSN